MNALPETLKERPDGIDVVLGTPDGRVAIGAGPADATDLVEYLRD